MCEVQGNSSTAKPNVTFEQVVEQIENLEEPFRKGERTLRDVDRVFFEACSTSNSVHKRLKTYLECKVMENDTGNKIGKADILKFIAEKIFPTVIGAAATKILFDINTVLSLVIVGIICILLGLLFELPMKIQHNKKCFYEICLKLLEQYLPPKNQINN